MKLSRRSFLAATAATTVVDVPKTVAEPTVKPTAWTSSPAYKPGDTAYDARTRKVRVVRAKKAGK
jgi:hypothetical protein